MWAEGRDMAISLVLRIRGGKRSASRITFPAHKKQASPSGWQFRVRPQG